MFGQMLTIFIVTSFLEITNFGHELTLIKEMVYHYDKGNLISEGCDDITEIEISLILKSF